MAEITLPPEAYNDLQQYVFAKEVMRRIRNRQWAVGDEDFWPRMNRVWGQVTATDDAYYYYSGIVGSISVPVAGTVRLTMSVNGPWSAGEYYNNLTDTDDIPSFYDAIIYDDDVVYQISGDITDNGTDYLDISLSSITDQLAHRGFTTASLVGRKVLIIKDGGIWEGARWPDWGNVFEEVAGEVTASASGSLTDSTQTWTAGEHDGKVLIFTSGGDLVRALVGGTAAPGTITFASGTPTVGTDYFILPLDLSPFHAPYFNPDRTPGNYHAWYAADITESFASHSPVDDSVVAVAFPKQQTSINDGFPVCGATDVDAYDADVWIELTNDCYDAQAGGKDTCLTPNFFKGARAWQVEIERLALLFLQDNWLGKKYLLNFSLAYFFSRFLTGGRDWFTSELTSVSGSDFGMDPVAFPVDFPSFLRYPFTAHYEATAPDGEQIGFGTCTVTAEDEVSGLVLSVAEEDVPGCTIRLALGWPRVFPLEFQNLYPVCAFVPDVDDFDTMYPVPETDFPGEWRSSEPSTTYYENGVRGVGGSGSIAFVEGYAARYRGSWIWDPTIGGSTANEQNPYIDKLFQGVYSEAIQEAKEARMSGTATGGSVRHLEDSARSRELGASVDVSWWDGDIREETGTADGGSTTTLSDSTKTGSPFWALPRHFGSGNLGYGRFVVEVDETGLEDWHARPITLHATGATETLTLLWALPFSASGKDYRIREHLGNLNLWRGRTATLAWPSDGFTTSVAIAYSDDFRLYFAADLARAVDSTTTYTINEDKPGGVYMRDGGEWVKPNQNDYPDTRGSESWPGFDCPWKEGDENPFNLANEGYNWGRLQMQDYMNWGMLTNGLAVMRYTSQAAGWTSRADPGTPEDNYRESGNNVEFGWDDFKATVENYYNDPVGFPSVDGELSEQTGPPRALVAVDGSGGSFTTLAAGANGMTRQWAYATVTGIPTRIPSIRHIVGYAGIKVDDPDPQVGTYPDPSYVFDNQGDFDFGMRAWGILVSSGASQGRRFTSGRIGNHDVVNWMPEPPDPSTSQYWGYYILQAAAVFEWQFGED